MISMKDVRIPMNVTIRLRKLDIRLTEAGKRLSQEWTFFLLREGYAKTKNVLVQDRG